MVALSYNDVALPYSKGFTAVMDWDITCCKEEHSSLNQDDTKTEISTRAVASFENISWAFPENSEITRFFFTDNTILGLFPVITRR